MRKLFLVGMLPVAMFASVMGWVVLMGSTPTARASSFCVTKSDLPATHGFDQGQLKNAATIIAVGKSRNVPPSGWVIALSAAMQESTLHNLPYGDRDSAGLFQQRPSQGWGSFAQVTDPVYAATAFFGGPDVPPADAGLLDVDGWGQMSLTQAAQAVQGSGFPNAYKKWEGDAALLVRRLAGQDLDCSTGAVGNCPEVNLPVETGLTPDARLVVRCTVARFGIRDIGGLARGGHINGSDHYTGRAVDVMIGGWTTPTGIQSGDRVADYFVAHAKEFGVTYVIWRAHIWSTSHPWRPYSHPDGRTDPTALHMDHVHVSVSGNAATTTKENAS